MLPSRGLESCDSHFLGALDRSERILGLTGLPFRCPLPPLQVVQEGRIRLEDLHPLLR